MVINGVKMNLKLVHISMYKLDQNWIKIRSKSDQNSTEIRPELDRLWSKFRPISDRNSTELQPNLDQNWIKTRPKKSRKIDLVCTIDSSGIVKPKKGKFPWQQKYAKVWQEADYCCQAESMHNFWSVGI